MEAQTRPLADAPLRERTFTFGTDASSGEPVLLMQTMRIPDCGCAIAGDGTLSHPLRVHACATHRSGMPPAWQGD